MRSLTEGFAPGTPTLPEGLRTLAVSPDRELEPGMAVRAAFTFRNQGGAPATGVRPEGLGRRDRGDHRGRERRECGARGRERAPAHRCGVEEVRVFEKNSRLQLEDDVIALETLDAYTSHRLTVRARIKSSQADRGELRVGATLHDRELGETSLGEASWRVDSHTIFSSTTSQLELASDGAPAESTRGGLCARP
ncbi:MAG: hypothetical protein M3R30_03585 [Candidatus Eremiobacteraeota bacterium]|nr:hypothetical protein [Candidatus Eremiobacteraeota bacterium]